MVQIKKKKKNLKKKKKVTGEEGDTLDRVRDRWDDI